MFVLISTYLLGALFLALFAHVLGAWQNSPDDPGALLVVVFWPVFMGVLALCIPLVLTALLVTGVFGFLSALMTGR